MVSFRRALFALACAGLFTAFAFGQTTTREITGFVGSTFNPSVSPRVSMTLGGAVALNADSEVSVPVDIAFKKNEQPAVTVRPEYVHTVLRINGHPIQAIAGLGVAFQASDPAAIVQQLVPAIRTALANVGTNVGYNAATGLTTDVKLGPVLLSPAVRWVKGSLNDSQWTLSLLVKRKVQLSTN